MRFAKRIVDNLLREDAGSEMHKAAADAGDAVNRIKIWVDRLKSHPDGPAKFNRALPHLNSAIASLAKAHGVMTSR